MSSIEAVVLSSETQSTHTAKSNNDSYFQKHNLNIELMGDTNGGVAMVYRNSENSGELVLVNTGQTKENRIW